MDYEKKYNEALEVMRQWIAPCHTKEQLDTLKKSVFPELAESEDVRIRKWLYDYFSKIGEKNWILNREVTLGQVLAYLERQKEQKKKNVLIWGEPQVTITVQKPEWSKEETKDLVHILKVLDDCYIYGKHDLSKTDYDNLTSTLKSLRPSWKPSEEQMKALQNAVALTACDKELARLYNQLKKL